MMACGSTGESIVHSMTGLGCEFDSGSGGDSGAASGLSGKEFNRASYRLS
jgi:hypothetical protein